jgi:hypothetical protein
MGFGCETVVALRSLAAAATTDACSRCRRLRVSGATQLMLHFSDGFWYKVSREMRV